MAANSRCAIKRQATFVNMRQSIFCKFSSFILDGNVLGIVDDHHAASVNKPTGFEIFRKVLIEQRFDDQEQGWCVNSALHDSGIYMT